MSISFTAYHCKNSLCRAPLFTNDFISVDAANENLILDNSVLNIPTDFNLVKCYQCGALLGRKINANTLKIKKSKVTRVTITN